MMKKQKNNSECKKTSPEEVHEKFVRFLEEEVHELEYQEKLHALVQMQNRMMNYLKTESDKQKMQVDHIELFRIHIVNKHNKN